MSATELQGGDGRGGSEGDERAGKAQGLDAAQPSPRQLCPLVSDGCPHPARHQEKAKPRPRAGSPSCGNPNLNRGAQGGGQDGVQRKPVFFTRTPEAIFWQLPRRRGEWRGSPVEKPEELLSSPSPPGCRLHDPGSPDRFQQGWNPPLPTRSYSKHVWEDHVRSPCSPTSLA